MNGWNPREPQLWAQLFGLVAVPLFGSLRARNTRGTHALMLDGRAGSFALSTSGPQSFLGGQQPLVWAWSANVRHAVSIDRGSLTATVRRWDAPNASERWPVERETEARALLESFEELRAPELQTTVIGRGLLTFRDIRIAIEKKGGSELDTILAFNTILAWVATQSEREDVEFAEAIRILRQKDPLLRFSEDQISRPLRTYPIGHLVRLLREGNSEQSGYLLDAYLLIRHASGPLYQEAHKQLLSPPSPNIQPELFPTEMLLVGKERPRSPAPSYVHHTPPTLARALVEIALAQFDISRYRRKVKILDPACGSGVFLIESIRELISNYKLAATLEGFDASDKAVAMSEFCVRHASADVDAGELEIGFEQRNSLSPKPWGSPDIVAMNPPFMSWEDMDLDSRSLVVESLGSFHGGRPDLGIAFFYRAIQSLPPGGILASIVPPSLFESETSEEIRSFLTESSEFQVRLIGHFKDNDYFDASVEPSFIVIARSKEKRPIRIVTADFGFADRAIRMLRMLPWEHSHVTSGFEIYNISHDELLANRWTPQPQRNVTFVRAIRTNTFTTVSDFFIPRLGIRSGNKPVFIVSEKDFSILAPTKTQERYFRPLADRIENGQIKPSGYIFYPYSTKGELLLKSESDVKAEVPTFYNERLRPQMESLKNRTRYREWWEPTRPVTTWLAKKSPRIVSQQFGRAGNFAFDSSGEFAVVQGVGWEWKLGRPDKSTLLAYLSIVNSRVFDRLIACFCQAKRGGQFEITQHFIERVPLPDLVDSRLRASLVKIGESIWKGEAFDPDKLNSLVLRAYGISEDGSPLEVPANDSKRSERLFRQLSKRWSDATGFHSRIDRKIAHPLYREIIAIGPSVIPFLLKSMRDDPGYWSPALTELTGEDPVPEDAETLDATASAWIAWGRRHGYEL